MTLLLKMTSRAGTGFGRGLGFLRVIGRRSRGDADPHNPFVSHAFLSALEDSGCVGRKTGWAPLHVLVEDEGGRLLGAAPCYLKSHSMGEYVFDHSWADAYQRAGGRYYPKLQVAVPFTPATGPRLLVPQGPARRGDPPALDRRPAGGAGSRRTPPPSTRPSCKKPTLRP